jgi:hypothetical protein
MGSILKIRIKYKFYEVPSQGEIVRPLDLLELSGMKKTEQVRKSTKQRSSQEFIYLISDE